MSASFLHEVSPALCDRTFAHDIQNAVQISSISSLKTFPQDHLDPQTLANNWGIGIETARRTIKVTTQCGVCTVLHPTLSHRFRMNDRQLRYRRLLVDMFTTQCLPTVLHARETSVPKSSLLPMDGFMLTQ